MKLIPVASNMTTIETDNGYAVVLFSYSTPVAAKIGDDYFKTSKTWSNTTTRHISKWLDGKDAYTMYQEFFDELLEVNLSPERVSRTG